MLRYTQDKSINKSVKLINRINFYGKIFLCAHISNIPNLLFINITHMRTSFLQILF